MPHHEIRLSRILVPTDFSFAAEVAYSWVHAMRRAFNAELILLHVIDSGVTALTPLGMLPMPSTEEDILERVRGGHGFALTPGHRVPPGSGTDPRGVSPGCYHCGRLRCGCHLIVMGTHGRTGLAHAAFGTVAEHVIHHSNIPVLAISQAHTTPSR